VLQAEGSLRRVLIADDSADLREGAKLLLEHAGYEVVLVENGVQALAAQRTRPSDVLITDIFMPESNGLETIEAFRREFPQTKIIAISGGRARLGAEPYLDAAGLAGADATLLKPFDLQALLRTLEELARAGTLKT